MAQHQSFTPIVNPIGEMPSQPTKPGQTFTKTSLAANKQVNNKFVSTCLIHYKIARPLIIVVIRV